jgi:LCP family protein required for cell wall assembly
MSRISASALRAFGGRFAIALLVSTLLAVAGVASVNREINSRVREIRRVAVTVAEPPPAGANFLIIGSDTRDFVDNEQSVESFGPRDGGRNSDTLMVAHLEPGAQRTLVVSFPRDLTVNVPGLQGKNKINAAYGTGGPQTVIDMLKENFDVDIHHYVEVDFKSFQDVVDAIGNVEVYFPYRTRDDLTGVNAIAPGCFPLDGPAALAYVRMRTPEYFIDGQWVVGDQDAPDLHRIERQQSFIRKLAGLAISKSLGDPFLALEISDKVLGDIKADTQLDRSDVNALIRAFRTVDVNDPRSIDFQTVPVAPDPANPKSTLVLADGAQEVIDRLRTFGDNTAPPPGVVPQQVRVRVLDGSGRGYAQDTLQKLLQYGFVSGGVGSAHRTAIASEIRYAPGHVAEAKLVLRYVDGSLVQDPTVTDGVVLVIGEFFSALTVDPTATTLPAASVDTTPTPTSTPATPGVGDTAATTDTGVARGTTSAPDTTKAPENIATTTTIPADEEC